MQISFDDCLLDTDRRELRRDSRLVAIEPQVFDILVYLVENRDRVVSKDDLIASVWRGRVVSDSTLDSRINAVRKAVGDSGGEQRLVRTIARKGFRFIGEATNPVKPSNTQASSPATLHQEVHFCTASDGVRIAYALAGQGPPVVKAANWLNHLEYDWQSPIWSRLLHELAARHQLIRYDERGNGLSDWMSISPICSRRSGCLPWFFIAAMTQLWLSTKDAGSQLAFQAQNLWRSKAAITWCWKVSQLGKNLSAR